MNKYLCDYDSNGTPYPGGLSIAPHAAFEEITRHGDVKLAAVLKKRN